MRLNEIQIIKEGYKEVKQKFLASNPDDKQDIEKYIEMFRDLVNRNQLQGSEKNIDYWGKQGYESFKEMVEYKSQQKSKTQVKRSKVKGESITLAENNEWLIVIPLDKDASCFHGKNTDWCTTKSNLNHFESYFYDANITLVYFIRKKDLNKWAIAYSDSVDNTEFFDKNDTNISQKRFNEQTGLDANKFIKMAKKKQHNIQPKREEYKELKKKVENEIENISSLDRNPKIENALLQLKDRNLISDYLFMVGKHEDFPIEFQKMVVSLQPNNIRYIINPHKKIQMIAVQKYPRALISIDHPDYDVQLEAISQYGRLIDIIVNPSKELQMAAVKNEAFAIAHIIEKVDNIDEDVIKQAIQTDGGIIRQLPKKYLSREMYLAAVKSSPSIYTQDYIPREYKKDKDFMLAAVTDAYMYTAKNLKIMVPKLIDEEIIETALETTNDSNIYSVLPIILNHKDEMNFDPTPLLQKRWKKLNEN